MTRVSDACLNRELDPNSPLGFSATLAGQLWRKRFALIPLPGR